MRARYIGLLLILISAFNINTANSAINRLPEKFLSLSNGYNLGKAGIIFIDSKTQKVVFSRGATKGRASASVLKLISMTSASINLGANYRFETNFYQTNTPGEYVLEGNGDPWYAVNSYEMKKYHRASLVSLFTSEVLKNAVAGKITLDCYGIYKADLKSLQSDFGKNITFVFKLLSSRSQVTPLVTSKIKTIYSPKLSEIIKFTLLLSDNLLADRLARDAAIKMGFGGDNAGLQKSFIKVLTDLNVPIDGITVFDGNGLSHKTRVSVRTLAVLLERIRTNPELKIIYQGLPVAGKTGTLQFRFTTDAPKGVGLVTAKTGWINNTVSLAGYARRGSNYWIFAIIDDSVPNNEYQRNLARIAIDKLVASIVYK